MTNEYAKLYQDPRWQKKRLEIMSRDKWKCVICDSGKETLHVHHEAYSDTPWDVADSFLHTLCGKCHTIIELFKRLRRQLCPDRPVVS